jgi:hypothetical protein
MNGPTRRAPNSQWGGSENDSRAVETRPTPLIWAVAALIAVVVSGCSLLPQAHQGAPPHRPAATRNSATVRTTSNELPTPPGPTERAPGATSAVAALTEFARRYINWDAGDVAADLQALARASVGQARSALQLAAAQVSADPELETGGVANHGTVEAVAPLAGSGRYVVVTRETTTATDASAYQGLAPAWHLTVATVRREPGRRWALSGWQPEN